ncbi:hypothetical protein GCM10011389_01090 [Pontibacillus salipaludis]|uniref:Uncharacterized protein n=1 Tax=Pontibacillus salipaludis TaxID=1697394 RepID=A0ABQ1PJ45_9BACI|nr:hypothetical protein GCM10011389_01090 [Pontibacillus salipaludis]
MHIQTKAEVEIYSINANGQRSLFFEDDYPEINDKALQSSSRDQLDMLVSDITSPIKREKV